MPQVRSVNNATTVLFVVGLGDKGMVAEPNCALVPYSAKKSVGPVTLANDAAIRAASVPTHSICTAFTAKLEHASVAKD